MYREPIEIPGHEIYPNIFRGKELLPRNNRLQIGILTGPSGAGKDRILTEMVENGYFKQLVTATTRRRRYRKGRMRSRRTSCAPTRGSPDSSTSNMNSQHSSCMSNSLALFGIKNVQGGNQQNGKNLESPFFTSAKCFWKS